MNVDLSKLDAQVFSDAANLIDREGWSGDGVGLCLWVAVSNTLDTHVHNFNTDRASWYLYLDMVCEWFRLEKISQVYELNDTRPKMTGHVWATTNLRAMARLVTVVNAQPLVSV